jgi:hypothetical protein
MKQAVSATIVVHCMGNVTYSALKEHGTHKSLDFPHGLKDSSSDALGSKISTSAICGSQVSCSENPHSVFHITLYTPLQIKNISQN